MYGSKTVNGYLLYLDHLAYCKMNRIAIVNLAIIFFIDSFQAPHIVVKVNFLILLLQALCSMSVFVVFFMISMS